MPECKCGTRLLDNQKCWAVSCCVCCADFDKEIFRKIDSGKHIIDEVFKRWRKHQCDEHGLGPAPQNKSSNGKHKGLFAFTLTMSPTDGLTEQDLLASVRKIMSQQSCPVKRFAWYLEYKDEGRHPHIHGVYETESGGRIESKHWKRAWSIWNETKKLGLGHRGGYHRPVTDEFNYSAYISKDNGISESKGF